MALLYENKQRFAADNLEIIKGEAPEALKRTAGSYSCVYRWFIGNLKEIVALLLEKEPGCADRDQLHYAGDYQ